jgi:hypothetical protein
MVASSNIGRSPSSEFRTVPSLSYQLLKFSIGCLSADSLYRLTDIVRVEVMLSLTVSRPVYLGVKPHLRPKSSFLLLSDNCGFVDVGHPLWREDESVVYIFYWPSLRSHSQVRVPPDSWPYFTASDSRLPQPGGPGPRMYSSGTLTSLTALTDIAVVGAPEQSEGGRPYQQQKSRLL